MTEPDLAKFKKFAGQAMAYDDIKLANQLLEVLKQESGLSRELEDLKVKLQFVKFPALPEDSAMSLVQTHLLASFAIPDYDLVNKIGLKISWLIIPEEQISFMQGLLDALNKNVEQLGNKAVKDWVKEYYDSPAAAAMRSSLDQVSYMNKSTAVKTLTPEQRNFLLTILKITDSLKNQLQELQSPLNPKEAKIPEDFDYSTLMPGVIQPGDVDTTKDIYTALGLDKPEEPAATAPTVPAPAPVAPPPKQQPAPAPLPSSSPPLRTARAAPVQGRPQQQQPQRPEPPAVLPIKAVPAVAQTTPTPTPKPQPEIPAALQSVARPVGANVNMQDILNSRGKQRGGVVFGEQTNVQVEEMSQRIEADRRQKQTEIDKKLAALKNRKNNP